jgi:hypothetical protein
MSAVTLQWSAVSWAEGGQGVRVGGPGMEEVVGPCGGVRVWLPSRQNPWSERENRMTRCPNGSSEGSRCVA